MSLTVPNAKSFQIETYPLAVVIRHELAGKANNNHAFGVRQSSAAFT